MVHMPVAQIYWMLARELFDKNTNNPMLARKVKHERKNCQGFACVHKMRKCTRWNILYLNKVDICICIIFGCYGQSFTSGKETS